MPTTLLTLAFLAVLLPDMVGSPDALPTTDGRGVALGVLLPMGVVLAILAMLTRSCTLAMDRRGSIRAAMLAERAGAIARAAIVAIHAVGVLVVGSLGWVRDRIGNPVLADELVTLSPVILAWGMTLLINHPVQRRLREARLFRDLETGAPVYPIPGAPRALAVAMRHQVLFAGIPLALLAGWSELSDRLPPWTPDSAALGLPGWATSGTAHAVVQIAGAVLILAVLPLAARIVLDTTPLGDGSLRESITTMARSAGVRIRNILVWRTDGQTINGAAIGVIGPLRYVLLTDGLIEHLPADQVQAVAAHEIGHVRRSHSVWLALSLLAAVLVSGAGAAIAYELIGMTGFWKRVPIGSHGAAIGALTIAVGAAFSTFGFVSRRFEWQADAFAAQCLSGARSRGGSRRQVQISPDAAAAVSRALGSVASITGTPLERFSWRHGSIIERQRRLSQLVGLPADRLPVDTLVRRLNAIVLILLCIGIGMAIWAERSPGGLPASGREMHESR